MIKKIVAALVAIGIFGELAYYSGILYLERTEPEEWAHMKAPIAIFMKEQLPKLEEQEMEEVQKGQDAARWQVLAQADRLLTKTYQYYLVEEQGYINIYLSDRETIYEYTNITMDMLPEELRQEIMAGKGLSNEGELYDFLENYSS